MSKFFCSQNLTDKVSMPCVPWEFTIPFEPGVKVRKDKSERQSWYKSKGTVWNFYSGVEPANNNQRTSKENPPKFLHALVADYDVAVPDSRLDEVIPLMPFGPAYIERSLGGNLRLIWILESSLCVDEYGFCLAVLIAAKKWLALDMLPGLDVPAWESPERLMCNGGVWRATGLGNIPVASSQAFFVKVGRDYRFTPIESDGVLSFDQILPALKERFPSFDWPSDFTEGSQGPSFWIEGSTSSMSAIVKKDGMFTFSAHAGKPFYSWSEILGKDFIKKYSEEAITKATTGIYFTGREYWRKIKDRYCDISDKEMSRHLLETCGVAQKAHSKILTHLDNECRIAGAAPFIFRPEGIINYMGETILNTATFKVMKPSDGVATWGANGQFPFISGHLERLFEPMEQLDHWLTWVAYFYLSGLNQTPRPGQNIYMMGPAGSGKTFTSRQIIGRAVGGFVDGSKFLVKGDNFGSENYHVPLWCIDDETASHSIDLDRFFAMLKKTSANQQFQYHKKFGIPVVVEWMGRVIVTANLDFVSSRILGPMDDSSKDKTCIFRCSNYQLVSKWDENQRHLDQELPYFLRYLVDRVTPAHIQPNGRFGWAAFHEPSLLDQSHQTGRSSTFKELLIEELHAFFEAHPDVNEWRGTVSQLVRMIGMNPLNDVILKSVKMEQVNRFLEAIQKEGLLKVNVETGVLKTRIWIFSRTVDAEIQKEIITSSAPKQNVVSIFSK